MHLHLPRYIYVPKFLCPYSASLEILRIQCASNDSGHTDSGWTDNCCISIKKVNSHLLGLQLLTAVYPFWKVTPRWASPSRLGIWMYELLYALRSRPTSSPSNMSTFCFSTSLASEHMSSPCTNTNTTNITFIVGSYNSLWHWNNNVCQEKLFENHLM